jgi:subtilase family serine protease
VLVSRTVRKLAAAGVVAGTALATGGGGPGVAAVSPHPFLHEMPTNGELQSPPTTAFCLANFGFHCYQPFQLANAYNLAPLHNAGIDGSGETILIVDSFGSPTIAHDLHAFDQTFGIPDPPSFQIRQDAGPVPAFDPTAFNGDELSWAAETSLDVEWSHVFAPGANIILEETPTDETEGVQGFPEMVAAENFAIDHLNPAVISQSFGATEETFPNNQAILNLRSAFISARSHHVTVLGSSGDLGATDFESNLSDIYPFRVNSWPSSDPLVVSLGGTMLTLDDAGNRLQPDVVWNDFAGAGGGGVSAVFGRPGFQARVQGVTGASRGTPDISMSAACDGGVDYYRSFTPRRAASPWGVVCGTSEASPEFAGVVAMADQLAGRHLGDIHVALYDIANYSNGLVDVTQGNNSFGPFTNSDGNTYTVQGFNAGPGYDLASGVGTFDAAAFVPALARAGGDSSGG